MSNRTADGKTVDAAIPRTPAEPTAPPGVVGQSLSGRTVRQVRADPTYIEIFSRAEAAFARAETAIGINESFEAFAEGVACMRDINARELSRGKKT